MKSLNALVPLPKDGTPAISWLRTRPARAAVVLQPIALSRTDSWDQHRAEAHDAYRLSGSNRTIQRPRLLAVA